MGFLGGLLERIGWHRPGAPAQPRRVAAPAAASAVAPAARPRAPVRPVEPMATASPSTTEKAATTAKPATPAQDEKPLDPEQLKHERELKELRHSFQAGILDDRFKDIDVDHRFLEDYRKMLEVGAEDSKLPPAAAFDVMRIVDDPNYPVKKVAAAISCDPALAGSVLSLANSPLHRGVVAVETLADAIVRLGQRHLRLLLLEIALHSTRVRAKPYEGFSTLTWKHSLFAAQLSYVVAKTAGADVDHAYMAGLFHDVGTFAVLTSARKLAVRQSRRVTAQTLLKIIDAHATEFGDRVVSQWNLPEPVRRAVVHRRHPHGAGDDAPLAAVVGLANDLCRPLGAWVPKRPVDFAHHEAVEFLKLDPARLPSEAALLELALKIEKVSGLQ
jgi:HD-like signal output (HDOD) protein